VSQNYKGTPILRYISGSGGPYAMKFLREMYHDVTLLFIASSAKNAL
jgi:hypothetical protein